MVKNNKINSDNVPNYRNTKADYAYADKDKNNNNLSPYVNSNTYGNVRDNTKFIDARSAEKSENLLSKSHGDTHYYNSNDYISAHEKPRKELKPKELTPKENNMDKVSFDYKDAVSKSDNVNNKADINSRPRVLNPVSAVNAFKSSTSDTTLIYEQDGRYYVEAGEDFSYYTSQNGADNAKTEGPAAKDSTEFHEQHRKPVLVTVRKGDLISIDNPYDMRCIHAGDERHESLLYESSDKKHAYTYRELRDTAEFREAENGLADAVILGGDEICKQATVSKGAGAKEITDPVVGAAVLSKGGGCSKLTISPSSRSGHRYDAIGVDVRDIGPDGEETILSIPSNNGVAGSSKTFYVDASAFSEDSKQEYIEFSQQGGGPSGPGGGSSGPGGAGDGMSLSAEKGEHSISSSSRCPNIDLEKRFRELPNPKPKPKSKPSYEISGSFRLDDDEPSKDDGPDF